MTVDGKTAFVTGAASGIGRSMVRAFASKGAQVVACDIDKDRLGKVVEEIQGQGGKIEPCFLDISDSKNVQDMVDQTARQFGGIDILCNNAGILDRLTPLTEVSDDLWEKVMAVNLFGPFALCRAVLPLMVEKGSGSIINTTSAAGLAGGRAGTAYTASKHGLVGLTRSIAWFYGDKGIRCNAVAPGAIQTKMHMREAPHPDGFAKYQQYFGTMPPHGKAMSVAEVACFLASDAATYINGAIIPVDGGWMTF